MHVPDAVYEKMWREQKAKRITAAAAFVCSCLWHRLYYSAYQQGGRRVRISIREIASVYIAQDPRSVRRCVEALERVGLVKRESDPRTSASEVSVQLVDNFIAGDTCEIPLGSERGGTTSGPDVDVRPPDTDVRTADVDVRLVREQENQGGTPQLRVEMKNAQSSSAHLPEASASATVSAEVDSGEPRQGSLFGLQAVEVKPAVPWKRFERARHDARVRAWGGEGRRPPTRTLTDDERKAIRQALDKGYTVDELLTAMRHKGEDAFRRPTYRDRDGHEHKSAKHVRWRHVVRHIDMYLADADLGSPAPARSVPQATRERDVRGGAHVDTGAQDVGDVWGEWGRVE